MKDKPKFLVFAPPFNSRIGGVFALHNLCNLINRSGGSAYLVPWFSSNIITALNIRQATEEANRSLAYLKNIKKFNVNKDFETPLYDKDLFEIRNRPEIVAIYPEVTFGNPLEARHVARWLLHNPGTFTKKIYFSYGEVQFLFSDLWRPLEQQGIETAPFFLDPVSLPWELIDSLTAVNAQRNGTAYMIRKGRGKELNYVLDGWVCIDDFSLEDALEILSRVKTFVSFDTATFWSQLASLVGCDSIVIPDEGIHVSDWRSSESDRYGVAYGCGSDAIAWARDTRLNLRKDLESKMHGSMECVKTFIDFWEDKLSEL